MSLAMPQLPALFARKPIQGCRPAVCPSTIHRPLHPNGDPGQSALGPGTCSVLGFGRGVNGSRSGLPVWPGREARTGAAPGPAAKCGPAVGTPARGGEAGGGGVPAESGPPLTICKDRPRQRHQQQQHRERQRGERQRGAHRVLASGREQVAAGASVRTARAWAPLREAWLWLPRPGGDPGLPSCAPAASARHRCGRSGLRRGARQRSGGWLRRGRCLRGWARPAAAATLVPSAPAPVPAPSSSPLLLPPSSAYPPPCPGARGRLQRGRRGGAGAGPGTMSRGGNSARERRGRGSAGWRRAPG